MSTSADRKRRYRARQREGRIVAPVVLTFDEIAMLEDAGVLRVNDEDDRQAIGEAVARLLETLARDGYASRHDV